MPLPNAELFHQTLRFDPVTGKFFRKSNHRQVTALRAGVLILKANGREWMGKRAAWFFHFGEYPAGQIRLRNGDPLDLRSENLVTASQLYAERNVRGRTCPNCGAQFQASNRTVLCCSRKCSGEWRRKNRSTTCQQCGGALDGQSFSKCRGCRRNEVKQKNLADKYGLYLPDLQRLLEFQGHKCAICGNQPQDGPVIDHDHKTGRVRGALCRTCNSGIGMLGDDPDRLEAAVQYLRKPTFPNVKYAKVDILPELP